MKLSVTPLQGATDMDKKNSGRKAANVPHGELCQRVVLSLPPSVVGFFNSFGGGNTSAGVRKAAAMLSEPSFEKVNKFS